MVWFTSNLLNSTILSTHLGYKPLLLTISRQLYRSLLHSALVEVFSPLDPRSAFQTDSVCSHTNHLFAIWRLNLRPEFILNQSGFCPNGQTRLRPRLRYRLMMCGYDKSGSSLNTGHSSGFAMERKPTTKSTSQKLITKLFSLFRHTPILYQEWEVCLDHSLGRSLGRAGIVEMTPWILGFEAGTVQP